MAQQLVLDIEGATRPRFPIHSIRMSYCSGSSWLLTLACQQGEQAVSITGTIATADAMKVVVDPGYACTLLAPFTEV